MKIKVVKFNCMVFLHNRAKTRYLSSVPLFKMGNDEIAFCNECKYFGHLYPTDINDKNYVTKKIRQFFARPYRFTNLVHVLLM